MTKNLAQRLVDLRGLRFTSQPISELCLDHAERGLNVAALVIPLEKEFAVELIQVIHTSPNLASSLLFSARVSRSVWSKPDPHVSSAVDLEGDVRHRLMVHYYFKVRRRQIRGKR